MVECLLFSLVMSDCAFFDEERRMFELAERGQR